MGNSLPLPCVRHHEAEVAAVTKKKRRKQKSGPACRRNVWGAARQRHVVPIVDTPPEDGGGDGGEVVFKEEPWRSGCRVEAVGDGGEDGGVRRVKIVVRRKDIAELVARLEQRDAAERNARMEELNKCLGGNGDVSGGGRVTKGPCRDAWRPQLSIIPENY